MANISNELIWWLLLGVLAGWLLFWFVDLIFRRDGDKATEREQAKIASLEKQLEDQKKESSKLRSELDKRNSDNRNLNKLSEELRDSINARDQEVSNLENALDAAKEQLQTTQGPSEQDKAASSRLVQGLSGAAALSASAAAASGLASKLPEQKPHDVLPVNEIRPGPPDKIQAADIVDIDTGRIGEGADNGQPSGSLSQRIGATSDDDLGPPDHQEPDDSSSLLDRLKNSLAGRRPEDLD